MRSRADTPPLTTAGLTSPLSIAALVIALGAAVILALAGPGYRLGWWTYRGGVVTVAGALVLGIAGMVVGLAAAARSRPGSGRAGFEISVLAIIVAAIVSAVPLAWRWVARGAPTVQDVSTDPADPPRFTALHAADMTSAEAGRLPGDATGSSGATPALQPLILDMTVPDAFSNALDVAHDLGWTIVAADSAQGRFEAVTKSTWFGMREDIAVRIRAVADTGRSARAARAAGARRASRSSHPRSRVDVRAVAADGDEQDGSNVRHVRHFLTVLARRN